MMQKKSFREKFFLTFLVSGLIMWIGGSIVRTGIAFDMYVPFSNMILKTSYDDAIRLYVVQIYSNSALYTGIGFTLFFIGYISLGLLLSDRFKLHGWIFMALMMFALATPYGLFELYLDMKLYFLLQYPGINFNDPGIKDFFLIRFTKLSIWGSISYLMSITGVLICIWRPLDKMKYVLDELADRTDKVSGITE